MWVCGWCVCDVRFLLESLLLLELLKVRLVVLVVLLLLCVCVNVRA